MRLAIMGKGGAGKTATTTMAALALAEAGADVLALDLDTNPGMAVSLGLPPETGGLSEEAIEERAGAPYGFGLASGLDPVDAVHRFGTQVRPHLLFLGLGTIEDATKSVKRHVTAILDISRRFDEEGWTIVGDLEAGTTTPFEGYGRFADRAVVLVNGSPASILAGRRILGILDHEKQAASIVVSQARPGDVALVEAELGPVYGEIPWDPAIEEAERRGSLLDADRNTPAWAATRELVEKLRVDDQMEVRA